MKLLTKIALAVVILIAGLLITLQVIDRKKFTQNPGIKTEQINLVREENEERHTLPKINSDVPELKGGPESITRTPGHTTSSTLVFYSSSNRALKQAALTFDDGPDVYYTPQILDILKQNDVKATFFIVGLRAQAHPEMVRRILSEGHSIGNHTWDHPILSRLSVDQVKDEVLKNEQLLSDITGIKTAMFRPPYGAASLRVVNEISSLGYNIIDWSVDTRDWAGTPVSQIMNYVRSEMYPGGIILEHCAGGKNENLYNTVQALPQIISTLKSQGYSFVMVQDLLNIPASK